LILDEIFFAFLRTGQRSGSLDEGSIVLLERRKRSLTSVL